ncbi:DUF397 domain-containing protein [Streptomyces sp. B1866]|uniref:DUF397 domain-containing protein n=1 Tax=Streptomyces sp. B1866 TaxID=3075431 RepID=UPI00288DA341|nr:DUF397 domain-containing protein [Streptomyces sp. B1866]MDT3397300.1 DUF397 domain-containing protein [Streptomyces sp. B1866]
MSSLVWVKSSYSTDRGGACVEVAVEWVKSSHSGDRGGDCVEVAACPEAIHVRDSKDIRRPALTLPPAAWSAFLTLARESAPTA